MTHGQPGSVWFPNTLLATESLDRWFGCGQDPTVERHLVAHRTARLNLLWRQLLGTRVEVDGWSVAKAAEAHRASGTTDYI